MRRHLLTLVLVALLGAGFVAPSARADGDPGSDVLVYQPLFLAADAGVSTSQQVRLGQLLRGAASSRFPIRVAIIASPSDLGAITGLWRKPRAYARFLGIELSLSYTGRLLVIMPNGFGFNWPGHPAAAAYRALSSIKIGGGGAGLASAAQTAVSALAAADHLTLHAAPRSAARSVPAPALPAASPGGSAGSSTDTIAAIVVVALLASGAITLLARRRLRRPKRSRGPRVHRPGTVVGISMLVTVAAGAGIAALATTGSPSPAQSDALATNPTLDPGTPLSAAAPDFTLTDELGQPVSLRSFRGRVVLLAFNDSECTTICPLTTTAMLEAKAMLGPAAGRVQLLGIDANPKATSLEDVLSYSQLHGMLGAWDFLTGSLPALRRVWKAYAVEAAVQGGQIAHTPALFVIDPQGRERKLYMTQQSYAAVGQLAQLVAQEASRLLPGHPAVNSHLPYSHISGITPATAVTLPRSGGGTARLAPGRPRLYVFFATWNRQVTGLAAGLEGLARYSTAARRLGLPALQAVDEASVEPPGALGRFLQSLPRPLPFPIAVDRSGRVGDGYEVEGLPWLMVVSATGRIAWYYSVSALGWPSTSHLIERVREALARAARGPGTLAGAQAQLAGSPPALAALHGQAARLLGSQPELTARVRALRGYPVVINAWASWCAPCRSEFGLFASASARYGRRVAFLGADTGDGAGDARSFLAQHPVSYPSYQTSTTSISALVPQGVAGLPTTIFINRAGNLVYVHTGQYDSQGTLDADIQSYALGG
ncbi:MAG TPA: redoxin domain-containing protein [Solirubrobacteraceae bacterium]|nr:redoxin domain-containing protein [Solirubrobacteraceae bacterium]